LRLRRLKLGKEELLETIASLLMEYEYSNGNEIIGCYVEFLKPYTLFEWNGKDLGRVDKFEIKFIDRDNNEAKQ
jgi:hypothetical protein